MSAPVAPQNAHPATPPPHPRGRYLARLSLLALGVVYGDIGTSPLYALREAFHGQHGIPVTPGNVLGVLSLIFWSLLLIVTVKYHVVIIRADNKGEGEHPALALVVGADDHDVVFHCHDEQQRPEDQREHAEHIPRCDGNAVLTMERLAQGVQRAGADVAVHHTEGQQREPREVAASRMASGAGGRGGSWVLRGGRGAHRAVTLCKRVQKDQRMTKPKAPTALTRNAVAPLARWKMIPSSNPPASAATPVNA